MKMSNQEPGVVHGTFGVPNVCDSRMLFSDLAIQPKERLLLSDYPVVLKGTRQRSSEQNEEKKSEELPMSAANCSE